MKSALKSEFIKLLTIRSTYVWSGIPFLLIIFFAFYIQGFKTQEYDQFYLAQTVTSAATTISLFFAVVCVLMVANEYRHSTITYSLTLVNRRTKVILSKLIVMLTYGIVLSAFALGFAIVCAQLGVAVSGHVVPTQEIDYVQSIGKAIFYCSGFALFGGLITILVRGLAASIVILFLLPTTIEQLLGLLLKSNAKYLPFNSLGQVLGMSSTGVSADQLLSPFRAGIVVIVYLALGWGVAWWLFLRRDAN